MLRRVLREPLFYFLLVGAALFGVAGLVGGGDGTRIAVTEAQRQRLSNQWQAQMGRLPTDAELTALAEQWIREEIYYREALAMGLDHDDVIIRRRLAQKLRFLSEDLATGTPPSREAVLEYFHDHAGDYLEPERVSFSHRYFGGDHRQNPQADADNALTTVQSSEGGGVPDGDPFMLQRSYLERAPREIAELFGREFAQGLAELPTGSWQGPLRSAYGWHLVRIEQRRPARQPEFAEVADRVAADYQQQRRRDANEVFYQSLRERYEIVQP